MKRDEIRKAVKSRYARVALENIPCCGKDTSCCGSHSAPEEIGRRIGYSEEELNVVPQGANLGLGCGNPVALASLREGEIVLDLGSGAGFDCFIAASRVGKSGKVIGIDMTPEMIQKARQNAEQGNFTNVEFRQGEIENLPVEDDQVDVILSNCVINLSPEKGQVFREAFRVLKPGGRLLVSDIVLLKGLPEAVRQSVEAYVGCVAGALMRDEYLAAIESSGFKEVRVVGEAIYPAEMIVADPAARAMNANLYLPPKSLQELSGSIASIKVSAVKPIDGGEQLSS